MERASIVRDSRGNGASQLMKHGITLGGFGVFKGLVSLLVFLWLCQLFGCEVGEYWGEEAHKFRKAYEGTTK